jgi:dehydrogenase/reductase SDR family protein 7B
MTDIAGKTMWVTGASSGIGRAIAEKASALGARVILSGRRQEALESVQFSLSGESLIVPFEATDYEHLSSVVDLVWASGSVDILINNAGISQRSLAEDTKPEVYRDLIDVDLIAPIWLTQLQLSRMIAAGGAHIVAISSIAGRVGAPMRTAYCAAKHGLIGYMDALRTETELRHNIRVTNVLPGSVATDVSRNALTADGSRRGRSDEVIDAGDDPQDCAAAILKAIEENVPELIFAQGNERDLAALRHADPSAFFEIIAEYGKQTAEALKAEEI